jgi:hypothetical protein
MPVTESRHKFAETALLRLKFRPFITSRLILALAASLQAIDSLYLISLNRRAQ